MTFLGSLKSFSLKENLYYLLMKVEHLRTIHWMPIMAPSVVDEP
jgi:hypothetical protein